MNHAPEPPQPGALSQHPTPAAPLTPASLARRLGALIYDTLLIAGLCIAYTSIVVLARGMRGIAPETVWLPASFVAIAVGFYGWFWTHGGQTLGMRTWRIRLVRRDGGAVGWGRALSRCAAACLSFLPAGLGYWWCLIDRERLCWHDRLSGTVPVRMPAGR